MIDRFLGRCRESESYAAFVVYILRPARQASSTHVRERVPVSAAVLDAEKFGKICTRLDMSSQRANLKVVACCSSYVFVFPYIIFVLLDIF